jgi:hypothetical protein
VRDVALRDLERIDPDAQSGWWARDRATRLWRVAANAQVTRVASGIDPTGPLAIGHGRLAARGQDGRLWVLDPLRPGTAPQRSDVELARHGGVCMLALAVIGVVEHEGATVLARFEADERGQWRVVARSAEAVLPDAVPVVVDLDGRGDAGHIAVLAGPDAQRYAHAVLGDDIEATRLLWLERHSLRPLRTLDLDANSVFEDRLLRTWRLPDGRTGLVTVRSGPLGAGLVVAAASPRDPNALEIAAAGAPIGTRNRWLSPASVAIGDDAIWAVHTPHIGGVLHRYRVVGSTLVAERVASGLTNHRLGARELDVSARAGRWLLLPAQDWRSTLAVDIASRTLAEGPVLEAPVTRWVTSPGLDTAALLTDGRMVLWSA